MMKRNVKNSGRTALFCAIPALCALVLFASCTSSPDAQDAAGANAGAGGIPPANDISAFYNKIWLLSEVRYEYGSTIINRAVLEENKAGDYFVLQFTAEGVNGKAAPNRYFAPYALRDKYNIALRPIVSTYMFSNFVAGGDFSEAEFYKCLQNINQWNVVLNSLYLFSTRPDSGDDVVMVFSPAPAGL